MNKLLNKENINLYLNYLFILYTGTFLIDSGLSRILLYVSSLLWLLEGDLKNKLKSIVSEKILLSYILLILTFFISIFFSDSATNGFWDSKYETGYEFLLGKPVTYSLMMFFIFTSLRKEFFRYLLMAFIVQVLYICIHINGVMYFDIFPGEINDSRFIYLNRIYLSIVLVISIFTSIYLYQTSSYKKIKYLYFFLIVYFIFNLFVLPGRTGQFIFFINILIYSFYFQRNMKIIKKVFYSLLTFSIIFLSGILIYKYSDNFQKRVDYLVLNMNKMYKDNDFKNSDAIRIAFNITSSKILADNFNNFIFGLEMGNAKGKYYKYLDENHKDMIFLKKYNHVHNQYFQTWIDGGLIGIFLLFFIFYFLFKLKVNSFEKLFIISVSLVFLIYGFSGVIFFRAKSIELFTLFITLTILLEKYYGKIYNEVKHDILK